MLIIKPLKTIKNQVSEKYEFFCINEITDLLSGRRKYGGCTLGQTYTASALDSFGYPPEGKG